MFWFRSWRQGNAEAAHHDVYVLLQLAGFLKPDWQKLLINDRHKIRLFWLYYWAFFPINVLMKRGGIILWFPGIGQEKLTDNMADKFIKSCFLGFCPPHSKKTGWVLNHNLILENGFIVKRIITFYSFHEMLVVTRCMFWTKIKDSISCTFYASFGHVFRQKEAIVKQRIIAGVT